MLPFFYNFPKTTYPDDLGKPKILTDILTSFILKHNQIEQFYTWQRYLVTDGETPLSIALKLYGDESLHWVILVVNNMINPYYDFPLESSLVEHLVASKYQDGLTGIHHFYDTVLERECDDVDSAKYRANLSLVPVQVNVITNYEYEVELNALKREIIIVNPKLIGLFVEYIENTLKEATKK
jgi:hypothetical protein